MFLVPRYSLWNESNLTQVANLAIEESKTTEYNDWFDSLPASDKKGIFSHEEFKACIKKEGEDIEEQVRKALAVTLDDEHCFLGALNSYSVSDSMFQWKRNMYKIDSSIKLFGKNELITQALATIKLQFLDNIDANFSRRLREEGYMSEMREYFRKTFSDIQTTPDKKEFVDLIDNYSSEVEKIFNRAIRLFMELTNKL